MMQKNKVSCCFRRVMFWSLLLAFSLIYTAAEELLAQEVRLRDTPAARLKLRIFLQNLGSATALNVTATFHLVLGEKTIATITPNQSADRLAPRGLPKSRYPEAGSIVIEKDDQNSDIILSLEELKAIQMGAPLGLVVTQVQADVARWNPDTQSYDSQVEWSSFEAEIDPVVVTVKANLGDDEIYNYQVYVGTDMSAPSRAISRSCRSAPG